MENNVKTEDRVKTKPQKQRKSMFKGKTNAEGFIFLFVFILFLIYAIMLVYPVVWGFTGSFKTYDEYFDKPFGFPSIPQVVNYVNAVQKITDGGLSFLDMTWNSVWFAGGSAIINMEALSIYAYVLNKYDFRGRKFLFGICLFIMAVPIGSTFVSTYRLMYALRITNSYLILVTSLNVYGMNLILFNSFYSNVSWSYAEAAMIDGAGFFTTYFKVMRPQVAPMMLTLGILQFISHWNNYMSPLLYLPKMPTLATGLFRYQSVVERSGEYPILFAGLIMCLIPIFILFGFFSNRLMQNISIGGLKG